MSVTTTVAELRAGDKIRFPDGQGGKCWAPVSRVLSGDPVELLLTIGGGAQYKSLPATRPVVRADREGEAS